MSLLVTQLLEASTRLGNLADDSTVAGDGWGAVDARVTKSIEAVLHMDADELANMQEVLAIAKMGEGGVEVGNDWTIGEVLRFDI